MSMATAQGQHKEQGRKVWSAPIVTSVTLACGAHTTKQQQPFENGPNTAGAAS